MVTETEVRLAYGMFLGREPESNEAVRAHLDCPSVYALGERFRDSREFKGLPPASGIDTTTKASYLPLGLPPAVAELDLTPRDLERMAARVETTWRELGASEPHWSVLSADRFRPDQITQNRDEFYASGEYDADLLRLGIQRHGGRLSELETCLEYGCGVGRVTWKLAPLFPRFLACDISETHLELARLWCGPMPGLEFRKIESALRPLDGLQYDAFFSRIVLQHNPPPLIAAILRSALRGLRPGGFALFQVPTYGLGYSFRVDSYLTRPADGKVEMHCLPQSVVFQIANENECDVLEVREDSDTGQPEAYVSNTFFLRRRTYPPQS